VLKKLTVRNFKSLDGVCFQFEPINLFVGPNSSGKSTALQAIEIFNALLRPSLGDYLLKEKGWDYRDLPHRKNTSRAMTWAGEFQIRDRRDEDPLDFEYEVEVQPRHHLGIGKEILRVRKPGEPPLTLIERTGRQTRIYDETKKKYVTEKLYRLPCSAMQGLRETNGSHALITRFKAYLERFQAFLLWNPKDLRRPHQGLAERLGPSGEQLPGLWAYLQKKDPRKAAELLCLLQRFFTRIQAIQSTGKAGWSWHHLNISERIGDKVIHYPADQASDGFLRMMAVFSLKYLPTPPRFITLEEPENGVHPQLISQVIEHLKGLADRKDPDKIQVFMTSHSPYVLNEFKDRPESVHIFEKGSQDPTPRIIPLRDRKSVLEAAETLNRSLGDLWYSNLLGGGAR
jgi:predicted ATPase